MKITAFWEAVGRRREQLESVAATVVADELAAIIRGINSSIGVEVSGDRRKEVVFTAGGDTRAFGEVHQLVESAPLWEGWTFIALKPAQGFDFVIRTEGGTVKAEELLFEPLESENQPGELGLLVLFPKDVDLGLAAEVAAIIIETGIGEEATSRIANIEVSHQSRANEEGLPITSLQDFVGWFYNRSD